MPYSSSHTSPQREHARHTPCQPEGPSSGKPTCTRERWCPCPQVSQRQMRLLEDIESSPQYLTRVKVKSADRIVFLPVDQIHWVEAADNYVILHAGRQTHILREKISALEAALDPERFFRISRSRLVNIAHISELRATFKGEHIVVLNDGSRLQMTRGIEELERLVAFC